MSSLTLEIHDSNLADFAQAYWALDEQGNWIHTLAEVESRFGLKRSQLQYKRKKACTATFPEYKCGNESCNVLLGVKSRFQYESLIKNGSRRHSTSNTHDLCRGCIDKEMEQLLARRAEALAARHRTIEAAVHRFGGDPHSQLDYGSINVRHAFLLDGLLRYAGDSWREECLAPWNESKRLLFSSPNDIADVLSELHDAGWLNPSPNSSPDAFFVSQSGDVGLNVLQVEWVISSDSGGRPYSVLVDICESVWNDASLADMCNVWEWICITELRQHLAHALNHFSIYGGPGWTDGIETAYKRLLDACSLGQAKLLTWKAIEKLSPKHTKGILSSHKVHDELPSILQRRWDLYQSQGWTLHPWHDYRPLDSRAIYVDHLFNRLLGGGQDLIDTVSRQHFLGHRPAPADPI